MFVSFNIKKQTLDRFNHCPSQIQHVEHYQDISSSTLRSSSQKRSLKTTASRNNNNNNYNATGNDNIKLKEVHISFKKILHFFTIISLSFMSRNFFSFFLFSYFSTRIAQTHAAPAAWLGLPLAPAEAIQLGWVLKEAVSSQLD